MISDYKRFQVHPDSEKLFIADIQASKLLESKLVYIIISFYLRVNYKYRYFLCVINKFSFYYILQYMHQRVKSKFVSLLNFTTQHNPANIKLFKYIT
jgi:hypothetical protein